jgi:glutathione peroxidase
MTFLIISVCLISLALIGWNMFKGGNTYEPMNSINDFHSLSCNTLDGQPFDFSELKGSKVLIVNTASACGFTPQYKGLQKLHEEYGETLKILGFPCNDFGKQESGSHEEIGEYCQKNYGVTFQMMEKVNIKGKSPHPVYNWLLNKSENGVSNHSVRWNFHKFIVDENGSLVGSFKSGVNPTDNQIISFASEK